MIERSDPPLRGEEAETLLAFLDYHRATLRRKVAGLSAEALARTLSPSTMTLGGMVSHLTLVEDNWFSVVLAGNPPAPPWDEADWEADNDWDWHRTPGMGLDDLMPAYEETIARVDAIIAKTIAAGGVEAVSDRISRQTGEGKFSLRWILLHMIEEYARHNGHADLLRESIDGEVGE